MLVTGGSGFLGTKLIEALVALPCARVLRLRRPGSRGEVLANVTDVERDVGALDSWDELLVGVDIIFHLAAQTSVPKAQSDPVADAATNVLPLLRILEACRKLPRVPSLVLAGTATTAGLTQTIPVSESCPDLPVTIYDLHKQMAEQYLNYYVRGGFVHGASLRLANVYGPGPRSSRPDRGILNMMMARAVRGETLTIYGRGEHLRDYVYVDDVVRAFILAAERAESLKGEYYLVGSGQGHTLKQAIYLVAERAHARTGLDVPVAHVDPPGPLSPIENRDFVADITGFSSLVHWKPQVLLLEGVDRTIEEFYARLKMK